MRNIAALNSPEQNAILAQPIAWPFPCTVFVSWSDMIYDTDTRIKAIKLDAWHWYKWLETKEANQ